MYVYTIFLDNIAAILDFRNQGHVEMPILQDVKQVGLNFDNNQITAIEYQDALEHLHQVSMTIMGIKHTYIVVQIVDKCYIELKNNISH